MSLLFRCEEYILNIIAISKKKRLPSGGDFAENARRASCGVRVARRYRGNSHCMRKLCVLERAAPRSALLGAARCIWKLNSRLGNSTARRRCAWARGRACTYARARMHTSTARCIQMPSAVPSAGAVPLRRAPINPPWHANNSWKKKGKEK